MVKVGGAGSRPGGFRRPGEPAITIDDEDAVSADSDDGSSDSDSEDDAADEEDAAGEITEIDEGQGVHNDRVAKTIREKAIQIMEKKGIYIDRAEDKMALQIFPRVRTIYYDYNIANLFFRSRDLLVVYTIQQL